VLLLNYLCITLKRMNENTLQTNLSMTHIVIGLSFTIITSIGGAYLSLREGDVSRETRLEMVERNQVKLEQKVERLEGQSNQNYQEILKILGEIKAELQNKQNRKD
jgi:hypothetical protein